MGDASTFAAPEKPDAVMVIVVPAACAKVGATFGTFLVPQLQAAWGLTGVLALMAPAPAIFIKHFSFQHTRVNLTLTSLTWNAAVRSWRADPLL